MNKKEFAKTILNKNVKTFIVHILSLSSRLKISIYSPKKAQIVLFFTKKVIISSKYLDIFNIFLKKKL